MKGDELISIRKFAEFMEVSDTLVRKWIDKGKVPEKVIDRNNPKLPRIWKLAAQKEVEAATDKKKQLVQRALPPGSNNPDRHRDRESGKTRGREKIESEVGSFIGLDMSTEGLMKLKYADLLNLKEAKAVQIAQTKIDEAEKRLVDRAETHKKLFAFGKTVRDAMESISDRVVDRLVGKNRDQMYDILKKEINQALMILTDPVRDAGI